MFGVPVARPVPWTDSLGDAPPQVGLALAATGSDDEQAAITTPAVTTTTRKPAALVAPAHRADVPVLFLVSPMPVQTWGQGEKFPSRRERRLGTPVPSGTEQRAHLFAKGGHLVAH